MMEELMKSLESSNPKQESTESNLPKQVNGVLAIHIKTLQLVDPEMDSSVVGLLQLRLAVCKNFKTVTLTGSIADGKIVCNNVKHFAVELPERSDDPENFVTLELLISSPLLPSSGTVLGRATLHLHNIIHDSPIFGHCELKDESEGTFAIVTADLIFAYGSFGFGESLQLHTESGHSHKASEHLHYSAFPRLTPLEHRIDVNGLTLTPHPIKHPVFIPFTHRAQLCVQETSVEDGELAHHTPRLLMDRMGRLRALHCQYKAIKDRRQRLKFLEDMVLSGRDREQSDANLGVTARTLRLSLDNTAAQ